MWQHKWNQTLQDGQALSSSSRYCAARGAQLFPFAPLNRRSTRKISLTVRAASGGVSRRSASSRRVYRESQAQAPALPAPVMQIASFILPAGAFIVGTFGMAISFFLHYLFWLIALLIFILWSLIGVGLVWFNFYA